MEQRKTAGRGMAVLLSAALAPAVGMPAIALADAAGAPAPPTGATQEGIQAADAAASTGVIQEGPQVGAAVMDGASEKQAAEGEAEVSGVVYPTLDAAVEAAQSGDTVTLVDNVELEEIVIIDGKSLTLELNGKTITNTKDIWANDSLSLVSLRNGADLTVNGEGTMKAKNDDCYVFDIKNLSDNDSELVINGGTFVGNISVVRLDGKVGGPYGKETAIINGGDFFLIPQRFGVTGYDLMLNCMDELYANGTADFIVNGGTFHGFNPGNNTAEGEGTNFLGYGAVVETNEQTSPVTYTVKQADRVAQVGDETFVTLEDAIAAAQSGDTVKVLDDISLAEPYVISDKILTIDLNGCTIESSELLGFTVENGTLTLDDTSAEQDGVLKAPNNGIGVALGPNGKFVMDGGAIDASYVGVASQTSSDHDITVNDGHIKGGMFGILAGDNKSIGSVAVTVAGGVVEGVDAGVYTAGFDENAGDVKVVVSGGEVKGTGEDSMGVFLHGYGSEAKVTGGTVTGASGIQVIAGSLDVSGEAVVSGTGEFGEGPFTTGAGIVVFQDDPDQPVKVTVGDGAQVSGRHAFYEFNPYNQPAEALAKVELAISGGTFTATGADVESAVYSEDFVGFVSGGTYNMPVDAKYIAPGFVLVNNGDGTYGVEKFVPASDASVKQLEDGIKAAMEELQNTKVSVDGTDIPADEKWVVEEARKALDEAIEAAEKAASADKPSQADIDEAIEDLDAAMQDFDAAKKDGTKGDGSGDQGGDQGGGSGDDQGGGSLEDLQQQLQDAIDKATEELKRAQGQALDELKKAVEAAEKALESGDKAAVEKALAQLNAALGQGGQSGSNGSGKPVPGKPGASVGGFATTADPAATTAAAVVMAGAIAAGAGVVARRRMREE